jgi:branched-chain amino acid transport system ATP-binding protein
MTLLTVDRINKFFGGVKALQEISFTVEEGAIFGIMGANGAGKTTLFSIIAGNTAPTSGEVRLRDRRVTGLKPHRVSRAGIARTFQIVRPFRSLTVRDNVETALQFGSQALARGAARTQADEILAVMDLASTADVPASALTLGGQKRLEVARALATGPTLLMLDEVMAGLTPTEVHDMIETIRRIRAERGITIMIIEHVMGALMTLSEHVVVLHHGEMIAEGAPAAIADDPAVQAAYLGDRS